MNSVTEITGGTTITSSCISSSTKVKEQAQNFHILDFSDEILLLIIKHLNHDDSSPVRENPKLITSDLINLAQTCTRFDKLLQDKSICERITVNWNLWVGRLCFVKFLTQGNRAQLITILNLNDVYWVPSSVIRNIGVKLLNLKALHVCGTQLGAKHLSEILVGVTTLSMSKNSNSNGGLESLSWTWIPESRDPNSYNLKPLEKLRSLCLFIPNTFNTLHLSVSPDSALTNFLLYCTNLERLWLFSCPKTCAEIKNSIEARIARNCSGHGNGIIIEDQLKFPNLQEFILSIPQPPKIHAPKMISNILQSLQTAPTPPKKVWIDHPLLHLHFRQPNSWPKLPDYSQMECLSIPLFPEVLTLLPNPSPKNSLEKDLSLNSLKHLQITHGNQTVISLNHGFLDLTRNLESFTSTALNYTLDWNHFIKSHPKLSLVNVSQDVDLAYPNFAVALSKLGSNLRRVSVPTFTLLEIRKCELIQEFRALAASSSAISLDLEEKSQEPKKPDYLTYESNLFKKGRRKPHNGANTSSSSTSVHTAATQPYVCGLDFLTHGCPNVEEFEIGFTKNETRGGHLVITSLPSIRLWKNLRKLTLDRTPIANGQFIIQIAQSCQLLEFLRMTQCGTRARCSYVADLCKALNYCGNLKDFRLEQNYIGAPSYILKALESCPKLQRLVIFSPSNDRPLEDLPLQSLMNSCTKLSVVYLILGSTPKSTCNSIRIKLENMYKSSRPPLSIMIRNSNIQEEAETFHYPPIHYRQMVVFSSQVIPFWDFPDKFSK